MSDTKTTCPGCGLQTLTDQKFCRSCGASLQLTTQPLSNLATVFDGERTRNEERRGSRLVLWGFIILFIGTAIGILGKKLLHDDIVTVVGVLTALAGMFLAAYPYLSPSRHAKYESNEQSRPERLTPSQPSKYLPHESKIEYVPSVTEKTTDLLKAPTVTRPRQKEDEGLES